MKTGLSAKVKAPEFFFILTLFMALSAIPCQGQTTITNSTFPSAGDSLHTVFLSNISGITVTDPGPDQLWDLTAYNPGNMTRTEVFLQASSGAFFSSYPNAELFQQLPATGETYFNVTNTRFENMGAAGNDPTGLGLDLVSAFNNPYVLRRAPLTYNSPDFTADSKFSIRLALSDLPAVIQDSLLDNLPMGFDSLGIGIHQTRKDEVDAWGTMRIPGGEYDVLREKRIEIRNVFIEIKVPFLGWQDITSLIVQAGGFDNFGSDTTTTYNYWSDETKEPVAVYTVDAQTEAVQSVEIKNNELATSVAGLSHPNISFQVFPNPAISEVQINADWLPSGSYSIEIRSEAGHLLHSTSCGKSAGILRERLLLPIIPAGQYFISLVEDKTGFRQTKTIVVP